MKVADVGPGGGGDRERVLAGPGVSAKATDRVGREIPLREDVLLGLLVVLVVSEDQRVHHWVERRSDRTSRVWGWSKVEILQALLVSDERCVAFLVRLGFVSIIDWSSRQERRCLACSISSLCHWRLGIGHTGRGGH